MLLLNYTYNNLAFLNEGLIDKMVIKDNNEFLNRKSRYSLSVESEDYSGNAKVYSEQDDGIVLFDKNKTKLAPDEVIITLDQYAKIDNKTYTFKNMTNYYSSFKQYEKDIDSIKETYFLDNYLDSFERYIQDFRLENHHPSMQISHMRDYFTKGKGREETVYFNRTSVEVYNDAFKLNMKELESNEGSLELNLENANSNLLADKLYNFSYQNYEEAVNNGFLEEIELINPKVNEIIIAYANYLHRAYEYKESYVSKSLSEIRYDLRVDFVNANKELFNNLVVKTKYSGYDLDEDFVSYIKGELKIVGFNIKTASDYDKGMVYLSEEEFKALKDTDKNYPYTFVLGSMPESKKEVNNLVKLNDQSFNGSYYRLENEITPTINYANDIVEMIANIFIYIGLGFALFAGLMLSNFIGTSVARKKKEIGILRALGASSFDVYEIFLYESLLIAFINFLLAVIGTLIAVIILNSTMKNDFGLNLKIFNFGFRQIIILLFISLFVALVASFLPVYKIARKRPVDAISNK